MRLLDDMYSRNEMDSVLETLRDSVIDTYQVEVDKYKHQSVLFLYLLFKQAEENHCTLKINTKELDSEYVNVRSHPTKPFHLVGLLLQDCLVGNRAPQPWRK